MNHRHINNIGLYVYGVNRVRDPYEVKTVFVVDMCVIITICMHDSRRAHDNHRQREV